MTDGATLGPYQLEEEVKTIGSSVCYRARKSGWDHTVLVKTPRPGARLTKRLIRSFEQEREGLASLRHPLLTTLVDFVKDEQQLGLVFVDHGGHRLDEVLERVEQLPHDAAMAIAVEVTRALAALHRCGHAHGRVRPELVELTAQGSVCLHGAFSASAEDEGLALPQHLAPEQILGEQADARSDVFLAGVLLYQMLAGQLPFATEPSELGGKKKENVSQRVRHDPPTPLGKQVADLPSGVHRTVMRCLAKRPADRFADITSVSSALLRALRKQTALPVEHLICQALAEAGLAEALAAPIEHGVGRGTAHAQLVLRKQVAPIAVGVAIITSSMLLWQNLREQPIATATDPQGIVRQPARLRVLAQPWAEVYIDGKLVDVTPVGRPIEVQPGAHKVLFKHPNAPDELRSIEIIAGQTILLDVTMKVVRPPEAGVQDAGSDAAATP